MKLKWIERLMNSDAIWVYIVESSLNIDKRNLICFGIEYIKDVTMRIINKFWIDVFESLYEFRKKVENIIIEEDSIIHRSIWYNKDIKINGKYIMYKEWVEKNLCYISQLLNNDGDIMDYGSFCDKFNIKPPFTLFYGLRRAISKYLKNQGKDIDLKSN